MSSSQTPSTNGTAQIGIAQRFRFNPQKYVTLVVLDFDHVVLLLIYRVSPE